MLLLSHKMQNRKKQIFLFCPSECARSPRSSRFGSGSPRSTLNGLTWTSVIVSNG